MLKSTPDYNVLLPFSRCAKTITKMHFQPTCKREMAVLMPHENANRHNQKTAKLRVIEKSVVGKVLLAYLVDDIKWQIKY